MIKIARIVDGIVVNIEMADSEWLEQHSHTADGVFIAYEDEQPAHVGLGWNVNSGFEQPPLLSLPPFIAPNTEASG